MTDLVLRDIDPVLVDRIRRISVARGWTQHQTVMHLLEQGLFASEYEVTGGLQHPEVDALAEAIAALKALPAGNTPDSSLTTLFLRALSAGTPSRRAGQMLFARICISSKRCDCISSICG